MRNGFRIFFAVAAVSLCIGATQPASAGEMSPETEKLFRAVKSNNFPSVKRSLLDGGDVKAENAAGLTVIDVAIDKGYFKIAHYLLAWRKQRQPKAKPPLPVAEPPTITPEAAPAAEPPSPEPAREAAPIAPKPPEPFAAAESAAKTAPTPMETETKPDSLAKPEPVAPAAEKTAVKTAEKATEIPPATPQPAPPQPKAAATPPSNNKVLKPAQAESPGILDRLTGYFTSDPEPEKTSLAKDQPGPEPKETEKAAEAKPETPVEQAAATAITEPKTEQGPDEPGVLDQLARIFASETEPEAPPVQPMEPEAKPEPQAEVTKPEPAPIAETAPEVKKGDEGPGVLDNIVRFFTSESETSKPVGPSNEAGKEPKKQTQEVAKPSPPPPEPEPSAKPAPEAAEKPVPESPAKPVLEAAEKPVPEPPAKSVLEAAEKPEKSSDIIARIEGLLSADSEKKAPPESKTQETASLPPPKPAPQLKFVPTPAPSPAAPPSTAPKSTNIELFIGVSMKLGKRRQKDALHTCVKKPALESLFCMEPVDWPQEIGPFFQVHTTLYQGRKSIVRYNRETATQFHTFFPTGNFDAIVEYFSNKFGPPSENPVIWTVMIGKPNRKNRTVRWTGPETAGVKNGDQSGAFGILEIREIDDLRWSSPPDERHGVVRLYRKGSAPVFRHVSWSDFLLARVRQKRK